MHLKQHLRQSLTQGISDLETSLSQARNSLERLKRVNTNNANYIVNLRSLWENEGEKSTETKYKGRLDEAIGKAETNFLEVNNRDDIQAEYSVQVMIGDRACQVPESFYKDFKRKR